MMCVIIDMMMFIYMSIWRVVIVSALCGSHFSGVGKSSEARTVWFLGDTAVILRKETKG